MADSTIELFNAISLAGGLGASDLFYIFRPGVIDLDFTAKPTDILSYVETNASAFAQNVHTHVLTDITDSGSLAALNTITDAEIDAAANISISKLAIDPLNRANHTGTQLMSTISDSGALSTLSTINLTLIDNITANRIIGSDGSGDVVSRTPTQIRTLLNIENGADVTDAANVNAAGAVMTSDYGISTVLIADVNNTPTALAVPSSTLIGRRSSGGIIALTPAQILLELNVQAGAQPNENSFKTISVLGQNDIIADTPTDTLTVVGGNDITITTDASTDTMTITSTAAGVGDVVGPNAHTDNLLARFDGVNTKTIQASGISIDDSSNMSGVNNLNINGTLNGRDYDADGTKLDTISNGADVNQNSFNKIKVSGQNDIVADSTLDALNISGGANIDITTDDVTDTLTISVNGGSALGDVFGPNTHTNNIVPVWDGIDTKTLKSSAVTISPSGNLLNVNNITLSGTVDGRDVAVDGTKLDSISSGAEVNQNAFNRIVISGQSDVVADTKTDTLNFAAGTNITLTTDALTDTVTISSTLIGTGDVLGPITHGDNILARFDGIDTKTIQASGISIDDVNNISGLNDIILSGTVDGRDISIDGVKLDTVESGAQKTDTANVNAAGAVMTSDYNNSTILIADVNNTPTALIVSPSTIVGRNTTGGIIALTSTETLSILGVAAGAEVNQNAFQTFVVAGESDIVADNPTDIFTFIAGSNVTLTTSPTGDALVINATGGAGDVIAPPTHGNDRISLWNGVDTKTLKNSNIIISPTNDISGLNNISLSGTVDGRDVAVDGSLQDSHIADATIHYTEASIDHTAITNIGTNTHAQIDTAVTNSVNHIADVTIHYTEASIDHTAITNIGTNTHAQIDTAVTNSTNHIADVTIHYTEASIDHTAITNIGTNSHTVIDTFISSKGSINGLASLDANGVLEATQIPPIAITDTFTVADELAQLALTVQKGDFALRTDQSQSYIALNSTNATIADWELLLTPLGVNSVFGRTGAVVATTNDYSWAQIDKTTSSLADITTRNHNDLQTIQGGQASQYYHLTATQHANLGTAWSSGGVLFGDGAGISQDNANFFWDDVNNRLGIGNVVPTATLDVSGLVYQTSLGESTFFGYKSGANDDLTLNRNSGFGYEALFNNTSGSNNSASGHRSLYYNTIGTNNTSIGFKSSSNNVNGNNNTILGYQAGFGSLGNSHSNNIFVGHTAGSNVTTGSNNLVIGYTASLPTGTTNNHLNIGGVIKGDLSTGLIGIGTSTPTSRLQVSGTTSTNANISVTRISNDSSPSLLTVEKARGAFGAETSIVLNDVLGELSFKGYDGVSYSGGCKITTTATQNWSGTSHGSKISFFTVDNTSTIQDERMTIDQNGNVGINTPTPLRPLHITGAGGATGFAPSVGTSDQFIIDNNGNTDIAIVSGTNGVSGLKWFNAAATYKGAILYDHVNDEMKFTRGGSQEVVITATGLGIKTPTPNTALHVSGGHTVSVTDVNTATYSILNTDYIINVGYTVTGSATIILPTAQMVRGRIIEVKDSGFNSQDNNITIATQGAELIENNIEVIINGDGSALTIYSDGVAWFIY